VKPLAQALIQGLKTPKKNGFFLKTLARLSRPGASRNARDHLIEGALKQGHKGPENVAQAEMQYNHVHAASIQSLVGVSFETPELELLSPLGAQDEHNDISAEGALARPSGSVAYRSDFEGTMELRRYHLPTRTPSGHQLTGTGVRLPEYNYVEGTNCANRRTCLKMSRAQASSYFALVLLLLDHVLPPHIPPAHHLDARFLSSEDGHIRCRMNHRMARK
jgi:hypothetical protein